MSYTVVQVVDQATQVVDGTQAPTIIEHGTISQPYTGPQIYVQTSAPVAPIVNDVWFDTSP